MKVSIGKYQKVGAPRVKIQIDPWDTWSLDHTLAKIIYPALLQLKATKHGVPSEFAEVGGESYEAQDSFDFYKETHNESFDKKCEMWDQTLDKIIWSFEQIAKDDYEDKYRHGTPKFDFEESDKMYPNPITGVMEKTYQMVDKNPGEHWTDYEGIRQHEERIQEGLELFGKYFRNLWD